MNISTEQEAKIIGLGWVLPWSVGSGTEILNSPEWIDKAGKSDDSLEGFSAKQYIKSVKGYLDPAGAYCLAASALAIGDAKNKTDSGVLDSAGVCSITRYGATYSAFKFFEQFARKGPRFASPLLFPHGYSNTAGNLVAIEFGYGGPHMVFYGNTEISEAFDFAFTHLANGTAEEMLVCASEAVFPEAVPDGMEILNGGIAVRLAAKTEIPPLKHIQRKMLPIKKAPLELGTVAAMMAWLQENHC